VTIRSGKLAILVRLGVLSLALGACATSGPRYTYTPRPFTRSNVAHLRRGLPGDSLIAMFGKPDSTYVISMGKKTDRPWEAVAWRYRIQRDPAYAFVDRPVVNTFYLYKSGQALLLHHWVLEKDLAGS